MSYVVRRRRPHSLNLFSSETNWPIKVKFHTDLLWDGGTKVCSNGPGHMTKVAAVPIYGKNLFLRNQKADDLKTWHASLGARVLPSLLKWWPWVDLDLFYDTVKFSPICFYMGKKSIWEKGKTMGFSETIVVYDLKLATEDRNDKKFLLT